ncbi:hypothetical protein MM236_19030 [Belliella sp. DSM 107340]|uniref:Uncharacterized protein n=1 Tax=Belliella calami TaxID=2923436 RepID=A0ABS9UTZ3_9BACT|nr:hypothetical protein [Belliella calami]MCH7400097.1 hypothetical protein [Belliella calami]
MIDTQLLLDAIGDYFKVTPTELQSKCRKHRLSYPRKMIAYILRNQKDDAVKLTARSPEVIKRWISDINFLEENDQLVKNDYEVITQRIQPVMQINLTQSQIKSLHGLFTEFLAADANNVMLKLISMHIDDINEKLRKRIKTGKANIGMDEKQQYAFLVWHYHFSEHFENSHAHAYMTIIDIIQQLKPIHHAKTNPGGNQE